MLGRAEEMLPFKVLFSRFKYCNVDTHAPSSPDTLWRGGGGVQVVGTIGVSIPMIAHSRLSLAFISSRVLPRDLPAPKSGYDRPRSTSEARPKVLAVGQ
jgi:hypothetical protein